MRKPTVTGRATRRRAVALAIAATCLVVAACSRSYDSLEALIEDQRSSGWVHLGTFGDDWPAKLVETREEHARIEFTVAGQRHEYRGFPDHRLKLMRFEGASGSDVVIVFRSAETAIAPPDR